MAVVREKDIDFAAEASGGIKAVEFGASVEMSDSRSSSVGSATMYAKRSVKTIGLSDAWADKLNRKGEQVMWDTAVVDPKPIMFELRPEGTHELLHKRYFSELPLLKDGGVEVAMDADGFYAGLAKLKNAVKLVIGGYCDADTDKNGKCVSNLDEDVSKVKCDKNIDKYSMDCGGPKVGTCEYGYCVCHGKGKIRTANGYGCEDNDEATLVMNGAGGSSSSSSSIGTIVGAAAATTMLIAAAL